MKHTLIAILALAFALLVPPAARADTPTDVYETCRLQMLGGSCVQLADPFEACKARPAAEQAACRLDVEKEVEQIGLRTRIVLVPRTVVFKVRGIEVAGPGDLRMCEAARAFCRADPNSLECLVALSNWGTPSATDAWRR
jgi:hypothetical protein